MPKQIGSLILYSVDDLHEILGLSKMTIRSYFREGKIRARKLGVQWFVTEQALRDYFGEDQKEASPSVSQTKHYRYIVQGVNDLVSEREECDTIEETIECIENQAIISLFQVAVVNAQSNEIMELVKARDFVDRHT